MRYATLAALLTFLAAVSAKPNGSPSCSVDGAADRIAKGMGANVGKIPCTFSADKTSYTTGATITISWACTDIDNFQGMLAYAAPSSDPLRRVGEFTLLDGLKSNKAICGDAAEKENSVVTHIAPGKFAPSGSITYTASSQDLGNLKFNFIILKKVDTGFRWGIFPDAVTVTAPGAAAEGANYGTVAAGDEYNCNCPAASTISLIRKCTPKSTATTKVYVTKTKTTTCTTTTTTTSTSTTTKTETVSASCGAVAGGEETPSSSMGGYGGYGGGYDSTPTSDSYGSYNAYEADLNEDEDDIEDEDEE
ncbi:hypothetical protein BJ742DRAFT_819009 [Cladochytrium replicatum]|nr:hypothetical protein BJ742DRAFT_819009 [Cladochytrium replicatum]